MNVTDGNLYYLLSPVAAFVAGLVSSLHCVGMCGPLSCSLLVGQSALSQRVPSIVWYHAGRLCIYALLGALVGGVGSYFVKWLGEAPSRLLPWVFVIVFLILALGLDSRLARWQARSGFGRQVVRKAYAVKGWKRGLSLGLVTPLIPCGPLYVMLWASSLAGSSLGGTVAMASFAIGTIPLVALAQGGWSWLSTRLQPNRLLYLRRGLACLAIIALCLRGVMDVGIDALLSGDAFCN